MHQHIKLQICKLLDTMLMFFCSVILFSQVRSKSCSKGSCKRREGEGENEKVNSVTFVKSTTFLNYVLLSSHSETTVVLFVWRFRLRAQSVLASLVAKQHDMALWCQAHPTTFVIFVDARPVSWMVDMFRKLLHHLCRTCQGFAKSFPLPCQWAKIVSNPPVLLGRTPLIARGTFFLAKATVACISLQIKWTFINSSYPICSQTKLMLLNRF